MNALNLFGMYILLVLLSLFKSGLGKGSKTFTENTGFMSQDVLYTDNVIGYFLRDYCCSPKFFFKMLYFQFYLLALQ